VITPHVNVASTQMKPTSPKKKALPLMKGPWHKVVESEDDNEDDNDEKVGESEEDEAHFKKRCDVQEKRKQKEYMLLQKEMMTTCTHLFVASWVM
jgi:hypothetical protein